MSYNLVNPTTGALTKVSGNISSNIIPSNASANNKLVTDSDTTKVIQLSGVVDLDSLSDYARYMGKAQIVTSLSGTTGLSSDFISNILNGGFVVDYINTSNTNTENFGVQVLYGYNSNSIYLRTKTYSSGAWSWTSWRKLVTAPTVLNTRGTSSLTSLSITPLFPEANTCISVVIDITSDAHAHSLFSATLTNFNGVYSMGAVNIGGTANSTVSLSTDGVLTATDSRTIYNIRVTETKWADHGYGD